ncbi:MAG: hypothetical protein SFV18_17480 [Bryobacteraceae bacterium]|nr:hypothetical protein [Bryobacteraceae bacterium]
MLRSIFRACYDRFRLCVNKEKHMSRVSLEHTGSGGGRRYTWGRKDEEYIADFTLVSRRTLTEDEYRIFKFHFLLGADWKLCCRRLKMDRGNFFHAVYRIQQKLGKVFRELQPYALYPLDEYFGAKKVLSTGSTPPPAPSNVIHFPWRPVPRQAPPAQPLLRAA